MTEGSRRKAPMATSPVRAATFDVVMGIDPGTLRLGWAVLEVQGSQIKRRASGVLLPPARWERPRRLGVLLQGLTALLDEHQPSVVAVETAFVRRDPRAALALGEARGLPIALAAARGIEVVEVSPSEVKQRVVGSGRASKGQVQAMVRIQLALQSGLGEDESDALAVALTAAATRTPAAGLLQRNADLARSTAIGGVAVTEAPAMTPARAYYAAVLAAARRGGTR